MSHGRQLVIFFVAVFAWTWGLAALMLFFPEWVAATFGEMSAAHPLFILAVYAPSLLSLLLSALFEGRSGVARVLARLHPLRAKAWWFLAIPVGMLVLSFVAGLLAFLLGLSDMPAFAGFGPLASALTVMFILEPGPIGEELGWRGFALPRMLDRWSPMTSGLVLGVIWAIWHLPAFFISGIPQQALALPLFFLGAVALSMLATWLFVRTAGSVLLSMLLHRMANGANDLTGVSFEVFAVGVAVVAVALMASGGLRKPAPAAATTAETAF